MSEMRVTNAMEDIIKLQYAESHKVEGARTWNSPEFLKFREGQLKPLNEAFTDFINKAGNDGESFYDSQALNNVYQNNISGKFRKEAGLNQPLWLRAANRLDVMNKEAVGEWLDGLGAGISPDGKKMNFLQKVALKNVEATFEGLYTLCHAMERAGVAMTKYALSDNKKDLEQNPLKFMFKKVAALPLGATIAAGGALYKTIVNPLYPIQSVKRAWKKKNDAKPKYMTLAQGAREMQEQRDNIRNAPTQFRSQELANAASFSRSRGAAFKEQASKILNGESRQPTVATPEKTSNVIQIDKEREL
jgi:hypothetical protein